MKILKPSCPVFDFSTVVFILGAAFALNTGAVRAQVTAAPANGFLDSLGICTHVQQGIDDPGDVANCLTYEGIRNFRDDGSDDSDVVDDFLAIHKATGAKICVLPLNGDIPDSLAMYETLKNAGALLAVEGPNEPNNYSVTYNGQTSSYNGTFLPVAEFQSDLYSAVKNDATLAGIPVFTSSESGGPEPDNVGLQFLTIPAGSNLSMPDGTVYADFANTHNYVCAQLAAPVANCAWQAEDPTVVGPWDGPYSENSVTWRNKFQGYAGSGLTALPRVTTETGWLTQGNNAITQAQQGALFLNLYLDGYKRGWAYTFIYMLRDDPTQGYWGIVDTSYTPKTSGVYIHNLTTILSDNAAGTPATLGYTIPNEPATVHDLLLQKSNGTFELAVWDEEINGTTDNVTVNLGSSAASVNVYDPTLGTAATQTLANVNSVTLTLSDHPQIIEIPPATTPASVTASSLTDADIGAPPLAGSAKVNGNTVTVAGNGADIWNASDQFNYDSTSVTGDATMIVHVDSITDTDNWARAGLMFRNSSAPGSAFVGLYQNPNNFLELQWRDTDGGQANYTGVIASSKPANWLELVRTGSVYTAYYATTTATPGASDWIPVGSHTTTFTNGTSLAGLAVTSHNTSALNTSVLSGFSLTGATSGSTSTGTSSTGSGSTGSGSAGSGSTGTGSTGSGSTGTGSTGTGSTGTGSTGTTTLSDADIGYPALAGSATVSGSTITVAGGGADIWNMADQFNYDSTSVTGDGTLVVHVDSIQNTDGWAKAGLMFRNSTAPSSAFVGLYENPGGYVEMQWRDTDGAAANYAGVTTSSRSANWLELVKTGSIYTAYYATTTATPGTGDWILIGTHTTAFSNPTYLAGLAVTAHNNALLNTTVFSGFSASNSAASSSSSTSSEGSASGSTTGGTTTDSTTPVAASGLADADIGGPAETGSATISGNTVTVAGGGADIWNASDQFNYDSASVTGDETMIVHVDSIQNTDGWAKAGLMFRNSAAPAAAYVGVYENPGGYVEIQWRDYDGGQAGYPGVVAAASANWLELAKSGATYTAYYATTTTVPGASDWILIGAHSTVFGNTNYLAGLAVTAHDNALLNTAVFSNFSLTDPPVVVSTPAVVKVAAVAVAQPAYTDDDIGGPLIAGSANVNGDAVSVTGSGTDIWASSDQFNYYEAADTADKTIIVHVDSMQETDAWAKAGPMFRNTSSQSAAFVSVYENPGNVVEMQGRDVDGGTSWTTSQMGGGYGPNWLKLTKSGAVFTAWYANTTGTPGSSDWLLIGTHTTAFTHATYLGGLAVTSHYYGAANTAVFSNLTQQ